jgi:hypothetical protein
MHVLPLPFGLALAVLPRREARQLRKEPPVIRLHERPKYREQILSDIRYAASRREIV